MSPAINLTFPHDWEVEVLATRPMILPPRHFVYPQQAEEVERGALEVLVRLHGSNVSAVQPFLATCALGFRDPAVPAGVWAAPNAKELCAVSGGYAYLIDTADPERFTFIPYRPVLEVIPAPTQNLLLFVGHRSILAWGPDGQAWESGKLSDEGVGVTGIDGDTLHGLGWNRMTDKETPFAVDLRSGMVR